jgi:3-oxoadipate enol-lactonase
MWEPQLGSLSEIRRVLAIDLPGHGQSTARPSEYRLEDLGRDVVDVADEAGLDRFDICGISIGGLIALWLAVTVPDRIGTLVVSNTAARIGTRELWSQRMEAVAAQGMDGIRSAVITRWFGADFARRDPARLAEVERMFMSVDPAGYIGCCAALRDADLRAAMPSIGCPTLIIGGDQDLSTPPAEAEWLNRNITGSRLGIITGAAHLANLDQPAAFNRLVMTALVPGRKQEEPVRPAKR